MIYDPNNIFAKILRGDIPCSKIYEDDYAVAFNDLYPQAPVHILVIPKGAYTSFDDFMAHAEEATVAGFFRAIRQVAQEAGVAEKGYRLITNHGKHAHQEVPHFHVHLVGGSPLGPLLASEK